MVLIKSSLLAVLLGALGANGYFLQAVSSIGVVQTDPIVDPGKIANHSHMVAGSSAFKDVVTTDLLRSGSCTSVPIAEDHSNYWVPQLYFQWKNGSFSSVPGGFVIYYLFDQNVNVTAFPPNFRMISGTQTLRTYNPDDPAQRAVTHMCLDFSGTSHTFNHLPSNTICPDGYRSQINFPSCWDGKNLDSPDHKSHVAFRSGGPDSGDCEDPNYPVNMPRIFAEVYWGTNQFNDKFSEAMYPSQPFVFAQGDGIGYGYHADFYNAWEANVLQNVLDKCSCTVAGFGDPTCCGDLGVVNYRATVPECSLETPSTFPVTGLLPNLPGNNQRTGLIAVNGGEIYANGTFDLAVPMDQQPPSGIEGVAAVSSSSVAAPVISSVKATSTASTVKAPTTSPVSPSSSSVNAPNSTPVSKPAASASSSSSAKPTANPIAVGSSGSGSNNNDNNNNWTAGGSSSSSSNVSTGNAPSNSTGGSQSSSTSNSASSSSNQSNQSNSNSGSAGSAVPPVQNSPTSSVWASSSQETASSAPSNNAGSGNSNAGGSSSGSSSQNSQAGSSSNDTPPAPAQNQPPSSGSGSSAASNSAPSPVASSSPAQGTSSANASTSTSPNADKCRNRHASSLEARAQSVPLKHISSHRHSSKSFIRMRNTGDMQI